MTDNNIGESFLEMLVYCDETVGDCANCPYTDECKELYAPIESE